ncbi:MAG: PAS domain S-box protein [Gemmatimonadetes bacterium]|nr:PAS domain S-box protein [Gemmatimonadota bacterium]
MPSRKRPSPAPPRRPRGASAVERTNRALRMLSDSNQALIRATDEAELLQQICRIAVERGGYRMAWVGLVGKDPARRVEPVAHAGFEEGYLATAGQVWGEGGSTGGPAAEALATGAVAITHDIPSDPAFGPRRETAKARGYRSAIALPLRDGEEPPFGVFKIYSTEPGAFDRDEVEILSELAGDLAYDLVALRTRSAAARTTEALRESNRKLEASQRVGHLGSWYRDLDAGQIQMTAESYRIFGLPHEDGPRDLAEWHPQWLRLVHPEDQREVAEAYAAAVDGRRPYDVEYRVVRADGEVRYVHSLAEVDRDAAGRPHRIFGTMQDVTERRLAEEAQRLAERRLGTLTDSFPDFVSRFDLTGQFTYVSPSVGRSMGQGTEAILGRTPVELHICNCPEEDEALQASLARVAAGGPAERLEVSFRTPEGPRHFEVRHVPERDARGTVVSVLGIATNLEDRKTAERQLYLLNYALDHIGEGIYLMEGDSPRFSYVNEGAAGALGFTKAELTGGMGVFDIDPEWTPEQWAAFLPEIQRVRQMTIETVHRTRGGRITPVEVTGNYFEFEGRAYNMAIVRDISERRAAEAELRTRERSFRTLVENTPDLLVRWDRNLNRVFVNPAFAAAQGKSVEDLLAGGFGSGHHVEAGPALAQVSQAILEVFATGEAQTVEHPLHTIHGPRLVQLRLAPERDDQGQVATVLGLARDITALKETERQLRTLAEHSPDVILRFDRSGRYLYANAAFERLTGVPVAAHLGRSLGSVTGQGSEELYRSLRTTIAAASTGGVPVETEVTLPLPDGPHDFNVRLVPEKDDQGEASTVLAVARDITAQKRAEADFRGSEQRFRQVTETIDEVFWLTDASKREFVYVSPAYARVFGRPCETLHADPQSWLALVHPDDRTRVTSALPEQVAGGYDIEYRILREGAVAWIHDRAFPIRDAAGRVYRIAGVAEDITVRHRLEEQLRQAQKMEAVGQLAGGIAHDFNNMLAVIQMQSTLLLEETTEPAEVRDGIREILAATERASNLTRQLLTFSRRQVSRPVPLDLGEALGNTTKLLRRVLGEDVALATRFAPGLPLVDADPGMMEQVLMNLAINARDAMPQGGQLSVSLDAIVVDGERASLHPGCDPGPHVCLTVRDTGCGIQPEALPRIFEPFFTTKEVGRGTGLGLATVFGIVQQHHGWIEVESAVGAGTVFRAYLPALKGVAPQPELPPAPPPIRGGHETILLVEDEPAVRAVSRTALEHYGYRVLEADSAASALELWEARGGGVDLLLTDMIMPGGASGKQLAEALLARAPGLRVLYSSGYSPDVVDRLLQLDAGRQLLQKPYAAADLAQAVRRCLDDPRS